jgi:hypothetical protein
MINTPMRNWINLFELKLVDGYKSSLSLTELTKLVTETDYRGVGYKDQVFIDVAYETLHNVIRAQLGIPQLYGPKGEMAGFDFYAYSTENGDPHRERQDWVFEGKGPDFQVGTACVVVTCTKEVALQNKEFARMVDH